MSDERDDVHADLRATMDSMKAPEEQTPASSPSAQVTKAEAPPEPAPRSRDEVGRFARREPMQAQPAPKPPITPKELAAPGPVDPPGTPAAPTDVPRPPATLKPNVRKHWASLPQEVREDLLAREGDVQRFMNASQGARKTGEAFSKAVEPYRAALGGHDPVQVAGSLFGMAATLERGEPAKKAQLLAHLIRSSGLPIEALNEALGQAPQHAPQPTPPAEFRDPRFDAFLGQMQERAQRSNAAKVEAFAKTAQHLDEPMLTPSGQQMVDAEGQVVLIRDVAADIIEMNARRGIEVTLEEAYRRAVVQHPELSKAESQRAAVQAPAVATPQARRAAAMPKNEPTAPSVAAPSGSVQDDIRAAIAQARGRR